MLTRILEFSRTIFSFKLIEQSSETASLFLGYFFIIGTSNEPFIDLTSIEGWISLGMFIIIWYGVTKIVLNLIWRLFFGKKLNIHVGILEFFHNKLKPVQAQRIIDSDENEFEKQITRKEKQIRKMRENLKKRRGNWRCYRMGMKDILRKANANKYTILGSIAAAGAVGVGAYDVVGVEPTSIDSMSLIQALQAGGFLGAGALGLKAIFGKGLEDPETFEARKAEERKNKEAAKAQKKSGEINIQTEANKLMKKHGISEEKALEVAKDKAEQRKKEAAKAEEERRKKKAAKLAKKHGISQEKAMDLLSDDA